MYIRTEAFPACLQIVGNFKNIYICGGGCALPSNYREPEQNIINGLDVPVGVKRGKNKRIGRLRKRKIGVNKWR